MSHMWVNGKAPSHMALHDRENQPVRREPEEDASYCSRTRAILIDQEADYINYLSADLSAPDAMVKMDITDIQYPDNTFDVIYCSHVLEHLQDDRKAMGEFYRVLKPGCWAILQVPITADTTFEDPTVISPKEKERLFGQHDHVRRYGPDYKDWLMEAGFSVMVDGFVRELDNRSVRRFGLMRDEDVYFCRKQAI